MTEIKVNHLDPYFPPLFKMDKHKTYPNMYLREHQELAQKDQLNKWKAKQEEKLNELKNMQV